MSAFDAIRFNYTHRDAAARKWKLNGGRVAGYFCNNVPEELILAAGFFPYRLSGDPWYRTDKDQKYGLPEPSYETILKLILNGKYDFVDFLIIPHSRDSVQELYPVINQTKKLKPEIKLPEVYFFDNLHTSFYLSQLYNRERTVELKAKLEEWSGHSIATQDLVQAIVLTNKNKALLKKIAELRYGEACYLSGTEALQIIGSSMFMHKEEHNSILEQFLSETEHLSPREGIRVFVGGSPLDNLQLYEIIESCGMTVVTEDNCWGNRSFEAPIKTNSDPFDAIVERYDIKPPCFRNYPLKGRVDYCTRAALSARVQGAVFNSLINDAQAWDIPDEISSLKEHGIKSLYLKKQPYLISEPEIVRNALNEFKISLA